MQVREIVDLIAERCESVLGFSPEIVRPVSTNVAVPLDFRIDKIEKTGFSPATNMTAEIDATLRLCDKTLKQSC